MSDNMAMPTGQQVEEYVKRVKEVALSNEGRKDDKGKLLVGLMCKDFSRALQEVARATTYGAEKYEPSNWLRVDDAEERYTNAMMRHFLSELSGESVDEESGILHAAMGAWNALARLELMLRGDHE